MDGLPSCYERRGELLRESPRRRTTRAPRASADSFLSESTGGELPRGTTNLLPDVMRPRACPTIRMGRVCEEAIRIGANHPRRSASELENNRQGSVTPRRIDPPRTRARIERFIQQVAHHTQQLKASTHPPSGACIDQRIARSRHFSGTGGPVRSERSHTQIRAHPPHAVARHQRYGLRRDVVDRRSIVIVTAT